MDVLDQYKQIAGKLKKRFLRKPNVTEACDCFADLGQYCENIEMPAYAGVCWIAAARCDGSTGNIPGELSSLIRSARNFASAELKCKSLGCQTIVTDNLQAALSCFSHAQTRLIGKCLIATGLNLEVVGCLGQLDLSYCKEIYIDKAMESSENTLDIQVYCLELLASSYIETGDYLAALNACTEIIKLLEDQPKNEVRGDIFLNCEINRIFLLLILKPTPQRLARQYAMLLETLTWGDKNDSHLKACCMSEELFLLLQSLVVTCQSLDTTALPYLEANLWPCLTEVHRSLLHSVVIYYSRS